jgi:hypothetical protein
LAACGFGLCAKSAQDSYRVKKMRCICKKKLPLTERRFRAIMKTINGLLATGGVRRGRQKRNFI